MIAVLGLIEHSLRPRLWVLAVFKPRQIVARQPAFQRIMSAQHLVSIRI